MSVTCQPRQTSENPHVDNLNLACGAFSKVTIVLQYHGAQSTSCSLGVKTSISWGLG